MVCSFGQITACTMVNRADSIKHRCVTFFHGSVVAYYAIVDFHMSQANYQLYQSNHPITKMFLGGNTQFFTTWNQALHQLYFLLSFLQDILSYSSNESHVKFCTWFDDFNCKIFIPVLFPATFMTMVNYWTIHFMAPNLMLADLLQFYPPWLNHAVHTFIVPILIGEFFITSHGMPPWRIGFKYATILMSSYAGWMYPLGFFFNQWPYPFLEVLTVKQHILFCPLMYIHGYSWYIVWRCIGNYFYGDYSKMDEELKESKEK